MTNIAKNLSAVRRRIVDACSACGRDPSDVTLLLATKTQSPERILEALNCGHVLTGENRVQELVGKSAALGGQRIERHMIGHLQSNKASKALDHVTCVQSIDRVTIARKLNALCEARGRTLDVFLQFNTSEEDSKFGADPELAISFAHAIAGFSNLNVRGLMTIGLLAPFPLMSRRSLSRLRDLRDRIATENIDGIDLRHLSMGMSGDLEIAIEEGSTMVRIGTDVFGERNLPPGTFWPERTGTTPVGLA